MSENAPKNTWQTIDSKLPVNINVRKDEALQSGLDAEKADTASAVASLSSMGMGMIAGIGVGLMMAATPLAAIVIGGLVWFGAMSVAQRMTSPYIFSALAKAEEPVKAPATQAKTPEADKAKTSFQPTAAKAQKAKAKAAPKQAKAKGAKQPTV